MLTSGTNPPSGVKESCMELTAPHEAAVVTVANRLEPETPNRTSLPSIFPPPGSTPRACRRGLPALSARQQTSAAAKKRIAMGLTTAPPPLVPSILIATWEEAGPWAIIWEFPALSGAAAVVLSTGVVLTEDLKFWTI